MSRTLIALLTAASFMTIGAAQAADKAKPAEAAKPEMTKKKVSKKHMKHDAAKPETAKN